MLGFFLGNNKLNSQTVLCGLFLKDDFSCHHKSLEVHSITALNACRRFVFQGTSPSNKNESIRLENP